MAEKFEKYTFRTADGSTKTVEGIPTATINGLRKKFRMNHREAVEAWMYEQGIVPAVSKETAEKMENTAEVEKPKRKSTRKPDETKREIVEGVAEFISTTYGNANVENPERLIIFTIGEDEYKLTLSKSRKAKN